MTLDTGETTLYAVTGCPTGSCDFYVRFDAAEMASCYGYDCTAYAGCWPPDFPDINLSWCDPATSSVCEFGPIYPVYASTGVFDQNCQCIPAVGVTDACCSVVFEDPNEWENYFSSNFSGQAAGCLTYINEAYVNCTLLGDPLTIECDESSGFPIPASADYVLEVDPLLSYVDIVGPLGSEVFALSGGGAAATGPARFVSGVVWAENGAIGSHDLTGWHWWFDSPIALDVASGSFVVEASEEPVFSGSGRDDDAGVTLTATIAEDATGSLSTTTWNLDFEQTVQSWTVVVHLEGAVL